MIRSVKRLFRRPELIVLRRASGDRTRCQRQTLADQFVDEASTQGPTLSLFWPYSTRCTDG